jgi:dienelactone hydrolase
MREALRSLMIAALSLAIGLPIALSALLYFTQERLIFHPQPAPGVPPSARALAIREVMIPTADGLELRGWLARPETAGDRPLPLLIYFGGNAEEVSRMAALAGSVPGWGLLTLNYRGYGGNPGSPSEQALNADALAIHDWAVKRADVDAARVIAFGRSLGSGLAVYLAAQRPLAGVVLVTPYDSLRAVAQRLYPFAPVSLLLKHNFDSLARAPNIAAPLLVLAAGRDAVVPIGHARALFAGWAGPKSWREFPAAGHNDLDADPGYWSAIADFVSLRR